jgi:ZIP family zinc transporter
MHSSSIPPASAREGWAASLSTYARVHWPVASALVAVGLVMLALLLTSIGSIASGQDNTALGLAFAGGMVCFAANAIGAAPALLWRAIPQRLEDVLLGFAAGMMLAASFFSLLMPGLEEATTLTGHRGIAVMVVVAGLALGTLLMLGLDTFTPHEHEDGGCGPGHGRFHRVWLFALAIALHNLPEGMAVGVGFANGDLSVGLPVATAIALQDMPEGLAVALAMRAAGIGAGRAVLVSIATGAVEPFGALLGVALSSGLAIAYPLGLSLAAGAMLFVVSHEVIPQTHRHGHETPATVGLMIGFALMMILDTTLG